MSRPIVKIHDYYLQYSSIVDAPVDWGRKLEDFRREYLMEYGMKDRDDLDKRLARVEEKGTSIPGDKSAWDTLCANRAGPGEKKLTLDQIYKAYCLREPIDGWLPE